MCKIAPWFFRKYPLYPDTFAPLSKSIMSRSTPSCVWSLIGNWNVGTVPIFLISTLSFSLIPIGTSSSGILGTNERSRLSFSSVAAKSISIVFNRFFNSIPRFLVSSVNFCFANLLRSSRNTCTSWIFFRRRLSSVRMPSISASRLLFLSASNTFCLFSRM